MKKIALISIFKTGNYGATLQAYALKHAIESNGIGKADIVNYYNEEMNEGFTLKHIKKVGIMRAGADLVDKMIYYPRMKKVNAFIDSYVNTDKLSKDKLPSLNDKYDIFMCGSDQLWNPHIQHGDYFYLLDFVTDDSKKRSYASSFGNSSIEPEYQDKYKELLSAFGKITVREAEGADIVEQLTGTRPELALDPALLLSKEQWLDMMPSDTIKGEYIFAYRMAYSTLMTKVASKLQEEMGCRIIATPMLLGATKKTKNKSGLSSLEWLRHIHDSKMVVTDSFHGAVFSIIFGKEFYYVVTSENVKKRLSRVSTLLKTFDLEDRIIYRESDIDLSKKIDYTSVHKKLEEERNASIQKLRELIG